MHFEFNKPFRGHYIFISRLQCSHHICMHRLAVSCYLCARVVMVMVMAVVLAI